MTKQQTVMAALEEQYEMSAQDQVGMSGDTLWYFVPAEREKKQTKKKRVKEQTLHQMM